MHPETHGDGSYIGKEPSGSVLNELLSRTTLVQPMGVFMECIDGPPEIMGRLLDHCEKLALRAGQSPHSFVSWLSGYLRMQSDNVSLVFYGKTIYGRGLDEPSDIDVLLFIKGGNEVPDRSLVFQSDSLPYIDRHFVIEGSATETVIGWRRFCVANCLAVVDINDFTTESIGSGRDLVAGSAFFNGGIGELITYAASKIIEGREAGYFREGERSGLLDKFSEKVYCQGSERMQQCRFSRTDMDMFMLEPHSFNEEVRSRLVQKLDYDEMADLAKAAMRRLRIREGNNDELAAKFVENLRSNRYRLYA